MSNKKPFSPADILLPKDLSEKNGRAYAVIACDQFTSEPEFWKECKSEIGNKPSTLNLILPEAFLEDSEKIIPKIYESMDSYLNSILECYPDSMIYLRRTQPDGRVRCGIVGMIDLEFYSYESNSQSLIRPTEKTVVERIPPRVKIRENAKIELPHVMLLLNDKLRSVIEPLESIRDTLVPAYDFDLMMGAGHVTGYFLSEKEKRRINALLARFATLNYSRQRYGSRTNNPLLFAVGDGNHSLASAKAVYENLKAEFGAAAEKMPERYALCEFVNIYDPALDFEPIYRIVKCSTEADTDELVSFIKDASERANGENDPYEITIIRNICTETVTVKKPSKNLPVAFLQDLLDKFEESHPSAVTDYIHDEASLRKLSDEKNTVGFLFKGMDKSDLFKSIVLDGVLPRKTFSMGHALDKRHYLEARIIKHK